MNTNIFANLMSCLLRELQMREPDNLHQKVCTLHFKEKPDIHFINHVPQYVDVLSEAGVLTGPCTVDTLQELLVLNSIDNKEWPIGVTLHRPTSTLVVWARHSLVGLEVPVLMQTMRCISAKVDAVQRLMAKPTVHPKTKSAATLLRMANFNRAENT